jgi:DNA-binding response OmpR family regulator
LQRIRRTNKSLPLIVVTARDSIADRVDTLDLGADDYLVKPFAPAELLARCRAHIRRARAVASSKVHIGTLGIDLEGRRVTVATEPLDLTRREWSVLEYPATNAAPSSARSVCSTPSARRRRTCRSIRSRLWYRGCAPSIATPWS